jgi:hypothetical protein
MRTPTLASAPSPSAQVMRGRPPAVAIAGPRRSGRTFPTVAAIVPTERIAPARRAGVLSDSRGTPERSRVLDDPRCLASSAARTPLKTTVVRVFTDTGAMSVHVSGDRNSMRGLSATARELDHAGYVPRSGECRRTDGSSA